MAKRRQKIKDILFMLLTLIVVFFINMLMQHLFDTQTLIPMCFVLGVFIVSLKTQGYFWGITASLISVLAVNYAFTFPYYEFDLITPECLASAVVMLVVAIMTGALTTKVKTQEKMKAESETERMRANLLRAVSHDLRTPLTSIYGSCSAIIENYDSLKKEQQLKLLGEIKEDSEWLIRMVENLLSVTRIDSERVQVTKMPTYVTKPFGTAELLARVRAALRNSRHVIEIGSVPGGRFVLQDMVIDYDKRMVLIENQEIKLTQTEYNIVALLSEHTGKVLTYAAIIREIWGASDDGGVKKLQVNMANIRKKLGSKPGDNRYIINELGVGYRMSEENI